MLSTVLPEQRAQLKQAFPSLCITVLPMSRSTASWHQGFWRKVFRPLQLLGTREFDPHFITISSELHGVGGVPRQTEQLHQGSEVHMPAPK